MVDGSDSDPLLHILTTTFSKFNSLECRSCQRRPYSRVRVCVRRVTVHCGVRRTVGARCRMPDGPATSQCPASSVTSSRRVALRMRTASAFYYFLIGRSFHPRDTVCLSVQLYNPSICIGSSIRPTNVSTQ